MGRPVLRALVAVAVVAAAVVHDVDADAALDARTTMAPREVSFRLDSQARRGVDWLLPFRDASIERLGPMRLYLSSRWGSWHRSPWNALRWGNGDDALASEALSDDALVATSDSAFDGESLASLELDSEAESWIGGWSEPAEPLDPSARAAILAALFGRPLAFDDGLDASAFPFFATGPSLVSNGFGAIFRLPPVKPVRDWKCRRGPVHVMRNDGEGGRFELVRCDGSMAADALDRVSILARPVDVVAPGDHLPDEPDAEAWSSRREWSPGIRVIHPRLVWALQSLADAFPRKSLVIYSGYRPFAEVNDGSGHRSQHAEGRALDVAVMRVPNEQVFAACKELRDVGCGFYPHNKFVHLHVRRAHSGKASWIDASAPGDSARYVESWPSLSRDQAREP